MSNQPQYEESEGSQPDESIIQTQTNQDGPKLNKDGKPRKKIIVSEQGKAARQANLAKARAQKNNLLKEGMEKKEQEKKQIEEKLKLADKYQSLDVEVIKQDIKKDVISKIKEEEYDDEPKRGGYDYDRLMRMENKMESFDKMITKMYTWKKDKRKAPVNSTPTIINQIMREDDKPKVDMQSRIRRIMNNNS
jgi:hypothetical protein